MPVSITFLTEKLIHDRIFRARNIAFICFAITFTLSDWNYPQNSGTGESPAKNYHLQIYWADDLTFTFYFVSGKVSCKVQRIGKLFPGKMTKINEEFSLDNQCLV